MPDPEPQSEPKPNVLQPYFIIETPTEGGPGLYTDNQTKRAPVRALWAVCELSDVDRSTLWRTLGSRGVIVQAIAIAMLNNPGLFEAVGAMMVLLQNDNERKKNDRG